MSWDVPSRPQWHPLAWPFPPPSHLSCIVFCTGDLKERRCRLKSMNTFNLIFQERTKIGISIFSAKNRKTSVPYCIKRTMTQDFFLSLFPSFSSELALSQPIMYFLGGFFLIFGLKENSARKTFTFRVSVSVVHLSCLCVPSCNRFAIGIIGIWTWAVAWSWIMGYICCLSFRLQPMIA